jgi:nitrite reductase/ring-hydroxylating ferredoxin subunit
MARDERLICPSLALAEGGRGVRFALGPETPGGEEKGFAIRHAGRVRAYVNRCPHMGTELDWQPGEFFDMAGLYLVCATHGALFEPGTGSCIAGPCRGAALEPLATREANGQVFLINDAAIATPPDEKP